VLVFHHPQREKFLPYIQSKSTFPCCGTITPFCPDWRCSNEKIQLKTGTKAVENLVARCSDTALNCKVLQLIEGTQAKNPEPLFPDGCAVDINDIFITAKHVFARSGPVF